MLVSGLLTSHRTVGAVVVSACGSYDSPTLPSPTPSPTPTPAPSVVRWDVTLWNVDQAAFGVRIRLDGETLYEDAAATLNEHSVEVERPFVPGTHTIEFEILRASKRRSSYKPHLGVRVTPTGPNFAALGVPKTLKAGQRLTVEVSL